MQFYHQTAASTAPMPEDLSFANQPYLMSLDSCNDTLYSWLVQWRLESLQVQITHEAGNALLLVISIT